MKKCRRRNVSSLSCRRLSLTSLCRRNKWRTPWNGKWYFLSLSRGSASSEIINVSIIMSQMILSHLREMNAKCLSPQMAAYVMSQCLSQKYTPCRKGKWEKWKWCFCDDDDQREVMIAYDDVRVKWCFLCKMIMCVMMILSAQMMMMMKNDNDDHLSMISTLSSLRTPAINVFYLSLSALDDEEMIMCKWWIMSMMIMFSANDNDDEKWCFRKCLMLFLCTCK